MTPFSLWQHDETGRTTVTTEPVNQALWHGWRKVADLYTDTQVREAVADALRPIMAVTDALRSAREYVADALRAERAAFLGHEKWGNIENITADLAMIDAAIYQPATDSPVIGSSDMERILALFPTPDACADAISELVVASGAALTVTTDTNHGTFYDSDDGHTYWSCCYKRLHHEDLSHADTCWTHALRITLGKFGVNP